MKVILLERVEASAARRRGQREGRASPATSCCPPQGAARQRRQHDQVFEAQRAEIEARNPKAQGSREGSSDKLDGTSSS